MPSSDTQFKQGQSGNPAGRPKGARNKLSDLFIEALSKDFNEHGAETIEELRTTNPAQYCQVIARLMPKLMELSGPDGQDVPLSGVVRFVKCKDTPTADE